MQQSEANFIDHLFQEVKRRRPTWQFRFEDFVSLRESGIGSKQDLVRMLPNLSGAPLVAAIAAIGILEIKSAGPVLVEFVSSPDTAIRGAAVGALSAMNSRRTYRPLARIAQTHPDTRIAEAACHALAFTFDSAGAELLLDLLSQPDLPPAVRAQAAEGMGNMLGYSDRRNKLFKRAARCLIASLSDPTPEVRFWCAYALGQIRARQAAAALTHLAAHDEQICPGWWRVGDEASDALAHIQGREWPDRTPLGWTETGDQERMQGSGP